VKDVPLEGEEKNGNDELLKVFQSRGSFPGPRDPMANKKL
jgi:hypothetical protein